MRRRALLSVATLAPALAHAQPAGKGAPKAAGKDADRGFYARHRTKERPVRFAGRDGVMLDGIVLLPMISELQHVPGVVLVAGSGPPDRDGNFDTLVAVRGDRCMPERTDEDPLYCFDDETGTREFRGLAEHPASP